MNMSVTMKLFRVFTEVTDELRRALTDNGLAACKSIESCRAVETDDGTYRVSVEFERKPHPTSEGESITDEEQGDE